jgi:integrase
VASLQAKHSKQCPLPVWTTAARATTKKGCRCPYGPTYYVTVRNGKRTERVNAGKDRDTAKKKLSEIQARVDRDEFVPVNVIGFEKWADKWLENVQVKPGTLKSYRPAMQHAKEFFGSKKLNRMTKADVIAFDAWLRTEKALHTTTRRNYLGALGTSFEAARAREHMSRNPLHDVPRGERPRKRKVEAAYFENDELARLLAAITHQDLEAVADLGLGTGMRIGEILGLREADVDLEGRVIRLRRTVSTGVGTPKSNAPRDVYLTDRAVAALRKLRRRRRRHGGSGYVLARADGSPLSSNALRDQLYAAMEEAGVPRIGPTGETRSFHAFRHTFAKIMLESGVPLTWVQAQLGHSTIRITADTYGHWERAARLRELVKANKALKAIKPAR